MRTETAFQLSLKNERTSENQQTSSIIRVQSNNSCYLNNVLNLQGIFTLA